MRCACPIAPIQKKTVLHEFLLQRFPRLNHKFEASIRTPAVISYVVFVPKFELSKTLSCSLIGGAPPNFSLDMHKVS